ncbi:protein arginine N-methyltransferase 9-like [Bicyclus anynana]|uniref:Protein arginine N-methyltransferase 9-like n=1 Tax=Bicyclus anynana TaxID=110368 RepID=A0A6J1PA57_BICAN|nr:protein arginine N-methyltransferase 9-like [Bicyclus anynana]
MSALAGEYIAYARQLASNGNYGKAVNLYFMAFEKNPQLKPALEPEFRSNIMKLNSILADANKIDEMFSNFRQAIDLYPENVFLMNEIGKYLYKFGYYAEAWNQFRKALDIDAGYVRAEKNLNSMKNLLVERWHYRMLNDRIRNEGYRAALHEVVKPRESIVLDVGTGTGLLAMYAIESKAAAVTACDGSHVMTNLTDCVLEDNRLAMSILVLNKMSTAMNQSDLGGKCSLIVTELFDAGLFGEHILQTLSHAWKNLLSSSGQVIPHTAKFFIQGAHSDLLNAKYQLQSQPKRFLNIPDLNVHMLPFDHTYDCEDLHQYSDFEYMTDPVEVVEVNFNDANDIDEKLSSTEPYFVELKALQSANINMLIGWFNLQLTPNITLTTDPRNKYKSNGWQQAVFFDFIPRNVANNETFTIDFLMNSGKLTLETNPNDHIMRVSPETLRFLNDQDYMKMIQRCIGMAYVHLTQLTDISEIKIIDLCPFPVFGWFMLKRGINSLTCYARTEEDREFLETVFHVNSDVPRSKITIIMGENWHAESVGNDKYHAIFCNILELCGDIDVNYRELAQRFQSTNLVHGGLFMPSAVTLTAQIVSCEWLDLNNRLNDCNVGYKIAAHINKYQVSQHFSLDLTNLEYTPLSDPIDLGNCIRLSPEVVNLTIKHDGNANAILCWYKIELMESISEVSTHRPNSFIDGTAFLVDPMIPMIKGNVANILCCVDSDGAYKLMIDLEST